MRPSSYPGPSRTLTTHLAHVLRRHTLVCFYLLAFIGAVFAIQVGYLGVYLVYIVMTVLITIATRGHLSYERYQREMMCSVPEEDRYGKSSYGSEAMGSCLVLDVQKRRVA